MPSGSSPVHLDLNGLELEGSLLLPQAPTGVVLVLHASAREERELDDAVAQSLSAAGIGALRLGLLTAPEASTDLLLLELRFNIALLSRRVIGALEWTKTHLAPECGLGLFGADTAGAAALVAAARRPDLVTALALLRGRPDLAVASAARLTTPTLLIAGADDEPGIHWNEIAATHIGGPHELRTVAGAGPSFAERGCASSCAKLVSAWFASGFASGGLSQVG